MAKAKNEGTVIFSKEAFSTYNGNDVNKLQKLKSESRLTNIFCISEGYENGALFLNYMYRSDRGFEQLGRHELIFNGENWILDSEIKDLDDRKIIKKEVTPENIDKAKSSLLGAIERFILSRMPLAHKKVSSTKPINLATDLLIPDEREAAKGLYESFTLDALQKDSWARRLQATQVLRHQVF